MVIFSIFPSLGNVGANFSWAICFLKSYLKEITLNVVHSIDSPSQSVFIF